MNTLVALIWLGMIGFVALMVLWGRHVARVSREDREAAAARDAAILRAFERRPH